MMEGVLVFLGGGLGSLCRYAVGRWLAGGHVFPWGTLVANVISCLVLGVLVSLATRQVLPAGYQALWVVGFCGGFSTFSSFSNELVQLANQGQWGVALAYLGASLLSGVLAVYLGLQVVE